MHPFNKHSTSSCTLPPPSAILLNLLPRGHQQTAGFVCPHTSLAISTPSRICVSSSTFFTSVSTVSHRGRIFAPPSTLPSAATPPRNRSGRPGRRPGGALRARRPLSRRDDYDDGLDADFDDDYFYDEDELMGGRGVPPIGGRRQRKSKVSLLPSQISKVKNSICCLTPWDPALALLATCRGSHDVCNIFIIHGNMFRSVRGPVP